MKTIFRAIAILAVSAVFGCAAYFAIQALSPPPDAISSAAVGRNGSRAPIDSSERSGAVSPAWQDVVAVFGKFLAACFIVAVLRSAIDKINRRSKSKPVKLSTT
jgi:hypothetical protein